MQSRVVAVVVLLACGCTTSQAVKAHRAGEIVTAAGLIGTLVCGVGASIDQTHEDTIMTAGLVFVPVSLLGALVYVATDHTATTVHDSAPTPTRRERNRAAAWELTKQAADAARNEDCTQVQAIAPRVRDLDSDFHLSVFLRDVAIGRCLRATD
jgi:hypothetical protein